ncbi:hypothetical protein [Azorhizobium sp. AG788]
MLQADAHAADLRRDRADRRPLRGMLAFVLEHHLIAANATFALKAGV